MFAGVCQPLLTSDDMGNFHFPIVNDICKMECRPAILFNDDKIVEFNKRNCSIILVDKYRRSVKKVSSNSDSIRLTVENFLFNLLES